MLSRALVQNRKRAASHRIRKHFFRQEGGFTGFEETWAIFHPKETEMPEQGFKKVVFSCYPVSDMEEARHFYEEVLGLVPATSFGDKW